MFQYLKFRIMLKPFLHLYLMFSFRQLDNDGAPTVKMTDKDKAMKNERKLLRTLKVSLTQQILFREHESQLQITDDKDFKD